MRIALNDEHEQLRAELRAYFAELVTPEVRAGLALATNEFDEDGKKADSGEFGDASVYKDVIRQNRDTSANRIMCTQCPDQKSQRQLSQPPSTR